MIGYRRTTLAALLAACSSPNLVVECPSSAICDFVPGGECVPGPSGARWCQYPDGTCSSGFRWSHLAGEGLAAKCVADPSACSPPGSVDAGAVDTTPPETTITGKPSGISGTSVAFLFESNEAGTFECSLDGGVFEPCSSPKDYSELGAVPNPHMFEVRARDCAGNVDATPATHAWQVDPNALDTTITNAPPSTSGPSVSFEFTSTRPGTFDCRLAPVEPAFAPCSSPKAYANLRDSNNPHTFSVRAVDGALNVDDSPAMYEWDVDSTGPIVTISSPTGATNPTPQMVFTTEAGASYTCRFDSNVSFACASGTPAAPLGAGPHAFYVIGVDSVGNQGPEASEAFTVDATPPTFTSFTAPAEDGISDPTTTITYALTDGTVTLCAIDGSAPAGGCTSPITLGGLLVGEHSFMITAADAVGNTVTVTRRWAVPPFANFQAAELALGQPNLDSNVVDSGGESLSSIDFAWGLATDGLKLWVSDANNCRVLQWNFPPTVNQQNAYLVLGQSDPMSHSCMVSQTAINGGGFLCAAGNRLYFSSSSANRILVWNIDSISGHGSPASIVLGQTSFTTTFTGTGAANLVDPAGMWCSSQYLVVADRTNNRVLIWNPPPTVSGEAADVVVGQPDFGITARMSPPTQSSTFYPAAVYSDGTRLFVSDAGNHRVLIWNQIPTQNGAAADIVLGQVSFADSSPNAGGALGPVGMYFPYGILVYHGALLVLDRQNKRILAWVPVPTSNGEPAKAVLGAMDLQTQAPAVGGPSSFFGPAGFNPYELLIYDGRLFVSDANRVVRFGLRQ